MKKILFFFLLLFSLGASAQVDIELRGNAPNNVPKLEVWMTTNSFQTTGGIVDLQFTIKWSKSNGVSLGTLVNEFSSLTLTQTGPTNAPTVYSDATYNYAIFVGSGTVYDYSSNNSKPFKIMTLPLVGTIGATAFNIEKSPNDIVVTDSQHNYGIFGVDGYLSSSNPFNAGNKVIGFSPIIIPTAAIAGVNTICYGSSTTLTASGGSGSYTYLWSNNINISTATSSSINVSPTVNTIYSVTVTDPTTGAYATTSQTVYVNNLTAGVIAGSQQICYGAVPTAFTSTTAASASAENILPNIPTAAITYRWESKLPTGTYATISGATSATYTSTALTTTTYFHRVAISTLNGVACESATTDILVTVNPLPSLSNCPSNITDNTTATTCDKSISITHPTVSTGCASTLTVAFTNGTTAPASLPTGGIVTPGGSTNYTFAKGITVVTYTVTDGNNNTAICTSKVTVQDKVAPTAVCQDVTVQLDATGAATLLASAVNNGSTDNCTAATALGLSLSKSTFACADIASSPITVTLTVTDASSNSNTCTSKVTVQDKVAPTAVCQDVTVQLDATGAATLLASAVNNGSTDNCTAATALGLSLSKSTFACADIASSPVTVTLTVTDASSNSNTCTSKVTVQDKVAPTAVCQDVTVQLDATGAATLLASAVNNGSTDNCTAATALGLSLSKSTFACADIASSPITVTLTVTDASSNSNTCTSKVTVQDKVAPTAVCQDVTVKLDATGAATLLASAVNNSSTDNCTAATALGLSLSKSTFACADIASSPVTVTLTVTDASSNSNTCTSKVTVQDKVAPTAVCQDVTVQLDATGAATLLASAVNNGSTDNCTAATALGLSLSKSTFACADIASSPITVTLTVTDASSNSNTCTSKVTVQDKVAPTAVCQDVTVQLDATGAATLLASAVNNGSTDNCTAATALGLSLSKSTFACADIASSPVTVTLTVTDASSNSNTCTSKVTVQDKVAPTAVCQDVTVQLDATGAATLLASAVNNGSTDNCTAATALGLSLSKSTFACADIASSPITVTLTVTDASSNSNTCTSKVTVQDKVAPTAVCQDVTVQLDATGAATLLASAVNNGSTDNCTAATALGLSLSKSTFACADIASSPVTVTLTVTDASSNSNTCTSKVTVQDKVAPTAVCQDVTVQLDATGAATLLASAVNNGSTDNCTAATALGLSLSKSTFACADIASSPVTVTLTVTDASSNSNTCTSKVTVQDKVAPTAVCQDVTVQLDATGAATLLASAVNNGSTDNCTAATALGLSLSKSTFACADIASSPVTVTLTVTDASSNSNTCTSKVTVQDKVAPTAVCQDVTVQLDATGAATLLASAVNNGSTDNCTAATALGLSLSKSTFACADIASSPVTVTLTVTDASSNSNTCTSKVTVQDKVAPTAVCQDVTVQLDATGAATLLASAVNNGSTDNCTAATALGLSLSKSTFACADIASSPITVTLTVTDASSNSNTCTSKVTVQDKVAPTAVCQDVTVQLDATGAATLLASAVNNGSTDNCTAATALGLSLSKSTFACADIASSPVTVTLTVTDASSNSNTCTSKVTVQDKVAPTAVCQDVTVQLDATGAATLLASAVNNGSTDNCTAATALGLSLSKSTFACADIASSPVTVTLTVTDASSNSNTCTSKVTVQDKVAPTAVCQDVTVQLDATGAATLLASAVNNGSTDNCTAATALGLSLSKSTFACADIASSPITVTLTVTDASSNSNTCTSKVTVQDKVAPTAVCQDVTVQLDATGAATLLASAVNNGSTDNCTAATALGLSLSKSTFACADIASSPVTVTLTVTDASSNSNTCTSKVTVQDKVAPTAVCQDVTVQLDATGAATLLASAVNNGSTDNCTAATALGLSLSKSTFACADIASSPVTVTLTVTDASSNSNTCTSKVTVQDKVAPTAVCQDVTVQLDATGAATLLASAVNNGSTDNCTAATALGLSLSKSTFACADIASSPITVTLTVTDASSNSNTCTSKVTVQDKVAPTAVCQDVTVQLDATGAATLLASAVNNGSTDNCTAATALGLSLSKSTFACADIASSPITVTLTVTDASSNSNTCTSKVTVQDKVAPTAVCQDVTVQLDATGAATLLASAVNNSSTDNCTAATALGLSLSKSTFACADIASSPVTVTLTVTDASSNSNTCTSKVTVQDKVAPTAVCQDVTVQLDATGAATLLASAVNNGSTDNCTAATALGLSLSKSTFACADIASSPITVTLTVTDASSNSNTCTSKVTVQDKVAPTAVCQDVTVQLDATGAATLLASAVNNGSTDNCTAATALGLSLSKSTFACADIASSPVTVTLTVTDASSNSNTCTSKVTVQDKVAPTAVCQDVTVQLDATGAATLLASAVNNGSTDNCTAATALGLSLSKSTFACADIASSPITVTLTVTDASSNSNTCTSKVIVQDKVAPVKPTLGDITAECSITPTAPTTSDNCAGSVTGTTSTVFPITTQGKTIVTWTFADGNGNSTTANQNVIIKDVTKPTAVCITSNPAVLLDMHGTITLQAAAINNGSNDNCTASNQLQFSLDKSTFTCSDLGNQTVTLTVTDLAGNHSSCTAVIVIGPSVTANAGVNITQTGRNFTMAASGGNGTWSVVSPSGFAIGNINPVNSPTATVTVNAPNTSITLLWTVTNTSGCSASSQVVLTRAANALNVKAFLAGPLLDGGAIMTDNLRSKSLIPTTSPYDGMITTSPSVFSVMGNNAIVDWVQVQLRSAVGTVTETKSALIQRDGHIVDVDGVSLLEFNATNGNYYVDVLHRNHLGVMTGLALPLSSGVTTSVDFTSSSTPTYGTNAQYPISSTVRAMYCGDASGDKLVKYAGTGSDNFSILISVVTDFPGNTQNSTLSKYNNSDLNLDGIVKYSGTGSDRIYILATVISYGGNQSMVVVQQF